jgi:hypothetical protein
VTVKAYPLSWPKGWPRAEQRRPGARYKYNFADAYKDVARKLRLFGAIGVVISTDVPLRRDGKPYSEGQASDPGVAVFFTRKGQEHQIACDQYDHVEHNMRALGLALAGLRAVAHSGVQQIVDRAFAGFAQLPSGSGGPAERPWREVLNLEGVEAPEPMMRVLIESQFRQLSRTRHPDAGGSHEAMSELNLAREAALKEVSGS